MEGVKIESKATTELNNEDIQYVDKTTIFDTHRE